MKLSIALVGLIATQAFGTPAVDRAADRAALEAECGDLGVMEWNLERVPKNVNISALRKCKEHPSTLGISSPLENPTEKRENLESLNDGDMSLTEREESLEKRYVCSGDSGRGHGLDYDYGCDNGWCWRNCEVDWLNMPINGKKPWCWLAYENGWGGWTPCGRWQDCEWSYNNKDASCGEGNCAACGCGC